jgi:hypothetical protein
MRVEDLAFDEDIRKGAGHQMSRAEVFRPECLKPIIRVKTGNHYMYIRV